MLERLVSKEEPLKPSLDETVFLSFDTGSGPFHRHKNSRGLGMCP